MLYLREETFFVSAGSNPDALEITLKADSTLEGGEAYITLNIGGVGQVFSGTFDTESKGLDECAKILHEIAKDIQKIVHQLEGS